jgi:hypothetical protein
MLNLLGNLVLLALTRVLWWAVFVSHRTPYATTDALRLSAALWGRDETHPYPAGRRRSVALVGRPGGLLWPGSSRSAPR